MDEVIKVLNFLDDWKSNKDIREHLDISQGRFYRLMRWMIKAKFVERCRATNMSNKLDHHSYFYRKL